MMCGCFKIVYGIVPLSMLYESLYVVSTNYFICCFQLLFLVIKVSMVPACKIFYI